MANNSSINEDDKRQKSRKRWRGCLVISIATGSCLLALLGPLWSMVTDKSISSDTTTGADSDTVQNQMWRRTKTEAIAAEDPLIPGDNYIYLFIYFPTPPPPQKKKLQHQPKRVYNSRKEFVHGLLGSIFQLILLVYRLGTCPHRLSNIFFSIFILNQLLYDAFLHCLILRPSYYRRNVYMYIELLFTGYAYCAGLAFLAMASLLREKICFFFFLFSFDQQK